MSDLLREPCSGLTLRELFLQVLHILQHPELQPRCLYHLLDFTRELKTQKHLQKMRDMLADPQTDIELAEGQKDDLLYKVFPKTGGEYSIGLQRLTHLAILGLLRTIFPTPSTPPVSPDRLAREILKRLAHSSQHPESVKQWRTANYTIVWSAVLSDNDVQILLRADGLRVLGKSYAFDQPIPRSILNVLIDTTTQELQKKDAKRSSAFSFEPVSIR